jgi:hypothetical protein
MALQKPSRKNSLKSAFLADYGLAPLDSEDQ